MSDKKNQLPKLRKSAPEDYEGLLENYRNAWQALRMIRETVEALGPPGAMLSEDGVLLTYGPEPLHEGQAIVDALSDFERTGIRAGNRLQPGVSRR